jgi:hypothetical protein
MKKLLPVIFIVLCAAAFVFGLAQLFLLRFEAGDVYPPYSSLRADPLGTMALCESLEQLPELSVRRDYSDANKLPESPHTTYLHLGADEDEWHELPLELVREIESFATRGGRLAIALAPVTSTNRFNFSTVTVTNAAGTNVAGRKRTRKVLKEEPAEVHSVSVEERWGLTFAHQGLEGSADGIYQPIQVTNATDLRLPARLDWHSGLVFTNLDAKWRVIYARGTNPVVVERPFGRGTVVMATDSYFLSNEAMWRARHPELLAWFVGPAEHVVFDEAHLGVVETSGVAVLMRKYRLYGVIGALVLLAGLFIWKNSVSLVPPSAEEARKDFITGKDAAGGFVNLLRRNIPPAKILDVCFEEWTKSLTHAGRHTIASVDRASEIMETRRERDPIETYQKISRALKSSRFQVPSSRLPTPSEDAPDNNQSIERNQHDHQKV